MSVKAQGGFTVLEVVVAIGVAGLLLSGLSALVSNINLTNDRTKDLTVANAFAENKFEQLRSATFSALTDGTVDFTSELPATLAKPRSGTYTVSSFNASVKDVDLTITFEDHGKTRTLVYSTFIGELGVGQY